ncbi:hypothetical protein [Solicola gregarius]|uniref:Uncharacterized protein n=1 Tax=Solicola gregarius TaxID=2908642 RepID=A0AA46TKW9_9ACTN|nr:hypothetical protein [Solicola gregarius]UYM07008.1 hypothetical protein L0C25_08005 [Solicola gregarius]
MDFWTIFGVVGFSATYAVMGAMLSLFVIGTWRRRGKGVLTDIAFAAVFVALPFLLGFSDTDTAASFAGWAVGGGAGLVFGIFFVPRDEEDVGKEPA